MLALRPYHCVLRGPLVLSGRGSAASACWITHFTAAGRRGTLASGELAAYTEQYRRIEAALPEVLRRVASNLPDGPARAAVHANLSDELGRPAPHLELFDTFGAAADHADWTASALAVTAASPAQVTSAAADGARAWWQFLDERQTTA